MRKLKWILTFGCAFLCMLLTACAIRSMAMNQTQSFQQMPITPSEIIVLPENGCYAPSAGWEADQVESIVTRPAVNTKTEQVTTSKPTGSGMTTTVTPTDQVTTTNPVTTVPSTTAKPSTTTPVTTAKPITTAPVTQPSTTAPVTAPKPETKPIPDQTTQEEKPPQHPSTDLSWFDDVVFLGDSITAGLSIYAQNGVLGNAAFVATPGYSVKDAISSVAQSNPNVYYNGVAMRPEDCIALTGKSKVYIMLGINDLCYGVDSTVSRYRQLIANIREQNPHVTIYVQSITPITSTCSIADENLNNENVKRYNQKLEALCQELGLVYLNVSSVMYDEEGIAFCRAYCRDPDGMGMHYTNAGYACWVEYLLNHIGSSEDEE